MARSSPQSGLHRGGQGRGLVAFDAGSGLGGQFDLELVEQGLNIFLRLGMTGLRRAIR